jgi:mannose-1-phosphate guanylyltransferase
MKAILLTAGFGTRLRPLTYFVPKCLLPVNGRPLIEYWLNALVQTGIESILMNLHYLADVMNEWLKESAFGEMVKIAYEDMLLGTGGTLLRNKDFVANDPVMLIHADNICLANLESFIHAHANRPASTEITMMTFTSPSPETCGIVEIDKQGVVRAFHEKVSNPHGNLANAAVYIVEPLVMKFLQALNKPFIDFSTEVIPCYIDRIYTFHNDIYHRDIGTLESYMAAQVECPKPLSAPSGDMDSWMKYCKKNGKELSKKMLSGLAEAFNAQIVEPKDDSTYFPKTNSRWRTTLIVLNVKNSKADLRQTIHHAESQGFPTSNMILFFSEVSSGFSSKKLFEEYGIKSLAVCACRPN